MRGKAAAGQEPAETYQAMGGLAGITALAPTADGRGAWAGGGDGLFRSDGSSWTPVGDLHAAVTSLDLDRDGRSAWVGTRALGFFHVDGEGARPIPLGDDPAGLEVVGTAVTAVGTRVVGARSRPRRRGRRARASSSSRRGEPAGVSARSPRRGSCASSTPREDAVVSRGPRRSASARMCSSSCAPASRRRPAACASSQNPRRARPARARAIAGRGRAARRGTPPAAHKPAPRAATSAVYYGTERRGARAWRRSRRPEFLSGAELVGDADRLTVACASRERCFVVTDGPRAWVTDGDCLSRVARGRERTTAPRWPS